MALFFLCLVAFGTIFIPLLSPYEYSSIHLEWKNSPPSFQFWMGTDELGRDIFTRICVGARVSFFIACLAAVIDTFIGVLWGSISAYFGGKVDEIMMRLADILQAVPFLLIAILLISIRGPKISTTVLAMTCTGWIAIARICRGRILQIKEQSYIQASLSLGASHFRIIFKHLTPNALESIVAAMTLSIPTAIFIEAFLSFMGLGIQAPVPSLGSMMNDGFAAMTYYPWRMFFPSIVMILTTFSFQILSNRVKHTSHL